jgi:hypothetical protein
MGKSQPDPQPTNPISERLEYVRTRAGVETLKDFWRKLTAQHPDDSEPFSVSYPSVRLYHFNRDPPVSYLSRVSRVFGFKLDWLASGVGPKTEEDARRRAELEAYVAASRGTPDDWARQKLTGSPAGWLLMDPAAMERAVELSARFHVWNERFAELRGVPVPTADESIWQFAILLQAPLKRWKSNRTGLDPEPERLLAYVEAAMLAIRLGMPDGRDLKFYSGDTAGEEEPDA